MLHHRRKPGDRIHHIRTRLPACTVFSDLLVELRKYLAPFLVQLLWRMHRRVRDGCGDVAEKRLLRLHAAAHKRPRLFHHRRVQIRALLQRQLAAVVHVGGGIIGVRNGLAFPAVKLIEPVVQRIRRALQVRVAQSPFTKGARAVAGRLKDLWQHRHCFIQRRAHLAAQIPSHITAPRMHAGHQHRPAWRAHRVPRVMRRKLQSFTRQPVNVRRLEFLLPITRQVSISEIIG